MLGIVSTIAFDLAPTAFGFGLPMNLLFVLYAVVMNALHFSDRRILGYATILSACNPANSQANMSFTVLLAFLTIMREAPNLGRVLREFGKQRWFWALLTAFLLVGLSLPTWPAHPFALITELKHYMSRLGFVVLFPLAVALTIRTLEEGVRALSIFCVLSAGILVLFFIWGSVGADTTLASEDGTVAIYQFIGNISMNFLRTQVCIIAAALGAAGLGLGLGKGFNRQGIPFFCVAGACVALILALGSTGSAFAMLIAMLLVSLASISMHRSPHRIMLGIMAVAIVGVTLAYAVTHTDNTLSHRIQTKNVEMATDGIDREVFWVTGLSEIRTRPFGEGWSCRTGHMDWLVMTLSYGWATGLFYFFGAQALLFSFWKALHRLKDATDRHSLALILAGGAAMIVYIINSFLDMPAANIGYYQTLWALILTPAAVLAVSEAGKRALLRSVSRV